LIRIFGNFFQKLGNVLCYFLVTLIATDAVISVHSFDSVTGDSVIEIELSWDLVARHGVLKWSFLNQNKWFQ
jgi:hypothetical protein